MMTPQDIFRRAQHILSTLPQRLQRDVRTEVVTGKSDELAAFRALFLYQQAQIDTLHRVVITLAARANVCVDLELDLPVTAPPPGPHETVVHGPITHWGNL